MANDKIAQEIRRDISEILESIQPRRGNRLLLSLAAVAGIACLLWLSQKNG